MSREKRKLLSGKELADELGRCEDYPRAMRRAGFRMPGGRATLEEARRWLSKRKPKWK